MYVRKIYQKSSILYSLVRNVTLSVISAYVLQEDIRQKNIFALVIGAYYRLKTANFKMQFILAKVTEKARTLIIIKPEFIGNVNQA